MKARTSRHSTPRLLNEALKKIEDPLKITRIFDEAATTRIRLKLRHPKIGNIEAVVVESKDYSQVIRVQIDDRGDRNHLVRLLTQDDPQQQHGPDAIVRDRLIAPLPLTFHLNLKNSNTYLFQAVLGLDGDTTIFFTPKTLFLVQRRKFYRLKIPTAYEMWVKIPNPRSARSTVKVRLDDISMGGVGLEMSGAYSDYLKPDEMLKTCKVTVRGYELSFDLVVRSIRKSTDPSKPVKTYVVGCEFANLSSDARDAIETYMLEHIVQLRSGSINLYEGDFT